MFGARGTGDTSGYGGLVRTAASAGSSERPYGGYFDEVADDLERAYPHFADAIERIVLDRGELTLHIKRERLVEVAIILRDTLKFDMCISIWDANFKTNSAIVCNGKKWINGAEFAAYFKRIMNSRNAHAHFKFQIIT